MDHHIMHQQLQQQNNQQIKTTYCITNDSIRRIAYKRLLQELPLVTLHI